MQTDLRGQNHKEKKSGGEVKRSLRFVGTAAAVLVVLGLVLGLQQILFPNRLEKTYQGMLLYADGTDPEAVTVTVQGTYTAATSISQEETFLGGAERTAGSLSTACCSRGTCPFRKPPATTAASVMTTPTCCCQRRRR